MFFFWKIGNEAELHFFSSSSNSERSTKSSPSSISRQKIDWKMFISHKKTCKLHVFLPMKTFPWHAKNCESWWKTRISAVSIIVVVYIRHMFFALKMVGLIEQRKEAFFKDFRLLTSELTAVKLRTYCKAAVQDRFEGHVTGTVTVGGTTSAFSLLLILIRILWYIRQIHVVISINGCFHSG